jgi:hypothetical protein
MSTMTDDAPETSLALMTLALAGVAIAIMVLILAAYPADGATICLTKKEARHLWPRQHIYWYSKDHCWSNRRGGPPRNLHIDPVFPKGAMAEAKKESPLPSGVVKIVKPDDYNEMDAQADADLFFNAQPVPFWRFSALDDGFSTWHRRVEDLLK